MVAGLLSAAICCISVIKVVLTMRTSVLGRCLDGMIDAGGMFAVFAVFAVCVCSSVVVKPLDNLTRKWCFHS